MILAHEEPAVLTLDVEGPATMTESTAVNEAARAQLSRGVRKLRIDLRNCTTMDSTFSGTLLLIERQLGSVGGTLTLVSPSPKVLEQLGHMGLEDFYAIDIADPETGPCTTVAPSTPSVDQLRRLLVEAHDELARRPGPVAQAFRTVAEELRRCEELRKNDDPPVSSGLSSS